MRRPSALLVAALAAVAIAMPASAITNGEPDAGRHPYVGLAVFDVDGAPSHRCSASLLTPTVVLTAGHCTVGTSAARIWFDEDVASNTEYPFSGATSYDGAPYTHPDFCNPCGGGLPGFAKWDVGIIVLSEPVPMSAVDEYAVLPAGGLVDSLSNKTPIDLVGYGVSARSTGGGPPTWGGPRVRLFARAELIAPGKYSHSAWVIKYTQNGAKGKGGTCFGDSGGPDLLAGTDTVIAVNSYVTNGNCAGVGYSSRIDRADTLAWIESFLSPST
jgi:hypothetical protein